MGLFGGGNNSASNTTNNTIDNSVRNIAAGGIGVEGDGNNINVTDGGAFELIGRTFSDITDLSKSNKKIESDNFRAMLDAQSGFSMQALDYTEENNARAINAVMDSNDRVSETVQKVNAANSGDMSQTIKQVSMVLVVGVVAVLVLKR
jgi:hypothetical protein